MSAFFRLISTPIKYSYSFFQKKKRTRTYEYIWPGSRYMNFHPIRIFWTFRTIFIHKLAAYIYVLAVQSSHHFSTWSHENFFIILHLLKVHLTISGIKGHLDKVIHAYNILVLLHTWLIDYATQNVRLFKSFVKIN